MSFSSPTVWSSTVCGHKIFTNELGNQIQVYAIDHGGGHDGDEGRITFHLEGPHGHMSGYITDLEAAALRDALDGALPNVENRTGSAG